MTRRERLLATLRGLPVDRPAVSFYEIGGWRMNTDGDPFTVWNDPSWRPLVELAHERTDLIRLVSPRWQGGSLGVPEDLVTRTSWEKGTGRYTSTVIHAPGRELTTLVRRERDVETNWTVEHPLRDLGDLETYLSLPEAAPGEVDVSNILAEERALGEAGIVSIESSDPLGAAARLFPMGTYTVLALTETALFHKLLERFARLLVHRCEAAAHACPGKMWRICGPEYAAEPYLPPRLYREYVVRYTGELVRAIRASGGYARIHSHGRLRAVLPSIASMEPDALDPLEPPPQGDMQLAEIRDAVGGHIVLMGNIEASDIENLPAAQFESRVVNALREGTGGRGFVLLPSACPYGRLITPRAMENYCTMVRLAEGWQG